MHFDNVAPLDDDLHFFGYKISTHAVLHDKDVATLLLLGVPLL
jgi:hypothetical protein